MIYHWDLDPTPEEVEAQMRPGGRVSRNDATRAALRKKLGETLGDGDPVNGDVREELGRLQAVLQAALCGGLI